MEDTPAFKEDKRSNSFDNSVSTIEATTEDNISSTSPSGSMIRGMLGESNGDDHDNSNNANDNVHSKWLPRSSHFIDGWIWYYYYSRYNGLH